MHFPGFILLSLLSISIPSLQLALIPIEPQLSLTARQCSRIFCVRSFFNTANPPVIKPAITAPNVVIDITDGITASSSDETTPISGTQAPIIKRRQCVGIACTRSNVDAEPDASESTISSDLDIPIVQARQCRRKACLRSLFTRSSSSTDVLETETASSGAEAGEISRVRARYCGKFICMRSISGGSTGVGDAARM